MDFLQKKVKANEGEVPQYYVENSHPAIIEPDEWALDAWSDTIWTVMVEKVLVHKDGGLTFGFYNGSEIRVVL